MQNTNKLVALLPLKANSDRVPKKNFRLFNGKPLFMWTLETLLAVDAIDLIVINTDARALLKENGLVESDRVLIRDRKSEICGDLVSMNKIIADDIESIPADAYIMTHVTNPLLKSHTLISALTQYREQQSQGKADSLFSVTPIMSRLYRKDLSPINHNPGELIRTQNLEVIYEENSNLYVFTRESFEASGSRIGKNPAMFPMSRLESIDIDDEETWALAELAMKAEQL